MVLQLDLAKKHGAAKQEEAKKPNRKYDIWFDKVKKSSFEDARGCICVVIGWTFCRLSVKA